MLIIRTTSYTLEDLIKILSIRATTENLSLQPEALACLGEIGNKTSLRSWKLNFKILNKNKNLKLFRFAV